ncbi:MAG: TonB-dependent receptor [Bacteroidales bacterium]|nr:MAG: TonB-dependent receptor [Bacteroidales bacterium]
MKRPLIFLLSLLVLQTSAQVKISGGISDEQGEPITGANIYFENSYLGTTSDSLGGFILTSNLSGRQILVVSFIGYAEYAEELDLDKDIRLEIVLEEIASALDDVVITAGTFEAGDKKKSAILNSIDIAATPSAQGDIYGALATMPGSQKVGEAGMIFVRGGESYETKTFMDGMLVQTPYFSNLRNIPTRGRFSPLLFTETVFSTGGYSAEYGQALSSIVVLNTSGLEPEDKSSISLMTVGVNGAHVKRWETSSLALTGQYVNSALNNAVFKHRIDWIRAPMIGDGTVMFRKKTGETGLIKSFGSFSLNSMEMRYDNFEEGTLDDLTLTNNNVYFNTTYNGMMNDKWMVKAGIACNYDLESTELDTVSVDTKNSSEQVKISFVNFTTDMLKIKLGGDVILQKYRQEFPSGSFPALIVDNEQISAFAEGELSITRKVALRFGGRTEVSTLLNEVNLIPRISAAYKTGEYSQLSFAYGKFHQNPGNDYLKINPGLASEKSDHYILNYQYRHNQRVFRAEGYLKKYFDLVKFPAQYSTDAGEYSNNGYGYARGIDIFWRDKKTFNNTDYWISYSFIDTERDYLDYPEHVVPNYVSAHNLSFVYKRFFLRINTFFGFTYSYASGRPYHDPNSEDFMASATKPYNDISFNLTYLIQLFKKEAIIHLNFTNVLGFDNVYGYRYRNSADENGFYAAQAIKAPYKRLAILLVSIQL